MHLTSPQQKFVQHKLSTALAEQTSQLPLYQSLRPILPSLALPEMTPAQLSALHSSALKIRDLISQTMPAVLDPFSASGKVPVLKPADRAGYLRSLVLRQLDRLSKMEKRRRSTGEERARMEKEDEEEAAQDMGWVMTDVAGIDEAKVCLSVSMGLL